MVVQIDFFNSPQNFSTRECAHRNNDTQKICIFSPLHGNFPAGSSKTFHCFHAITIKNLTCQYLIPTYLPTYYVIYLFTLIYLNVVWSLKNLFFTADIITIYYFNSILYYMLYDNIILKLIRKYNILWIRKINVFPTVFLSL